MMTVTQGYLNPTQRAPYGLNTRNTQQPSPFAQLFYANQLSQKTGRNPSLVAKPSARGLFSTIKQNLKKIALAAGMFLVAKKVLGRLKPKQDAILN